MGFEVARSGANSRELARTFFRWKHDEKTMNYEGWSKSRELARTFTRNFLAVINEAEEKIFEQKLTKGTKGRDCSAKMLRSYEGAQ